MSLIHKIPPVLWGILMISGCTQQGPEETPNEAKETIVVPMEELIQSQEGLIYHDKSKTPFTGKATEHFPFQLANPPLKVTRHFKEGKIHGLTTWYFNDGNKRLEMSFHEGRKEGLATNWYKTGEVQWKRTFKNDLLEGDSIKYQQDGQVKTHVIYNKGMVVKSIK